MIVGLGFNDCRDSVLMGFDELKFGGVSFFAVASDSDCYKCHTLPATPITYIGMLLNPKP